MQADDLSGTSAVPLRRGDFLHALSGGSVWLGAAPVILAAVLRLYNLGPRNMWYDEVFSLLVAQHDLPGVIAATAGDVHPPLYYALLHFWLLPGVGLEWARVLSVIFGILSVAVVYLVGRRLLGWKCALVGASILAINPFQLYYAQETRMYALLEACELLGAYGFLRALQGGRRWYWALFVVAEIVAVYTHATAAVYLLALNIYALLTVTATLPGLRSLRRYVLSPDSPRRFIIALGVADMGVLLAFLPWLRVVLGQAGKLETGFWIPPPGVVDLIRTLLAFNFEVLPAVAWSLALFLAASLLLLALLVLESIRAARSPASVGPPVLFLVTMVFVPPVLLFLLSMRWPMYVHKALITSGAVYCLLLGWMFVTMRSRVVAGALAVGFIALTVWTALYYYTFDDFPRVSYQPALAYVRDHLSPGDVVIHDNKLSFFPFYYLDRAFPEVFLPDPAGSLSDTLDPRTQDVLGLHPTPLADATVGGSRAWLIIFQEAIDEATNRGVAHPNVDWFNRRYRLVEEKRFSALNVYLFEPKK